MFASANVGVQAGYEARAGVCQGVGTENPGADDAIKALEDASGYIKNETGGRGLHVRRVPDLHSR